MAVYFNIAWGSGTVTKEWQTGVVVPLFKKGASGCVPSTEVSHYSARLASGRNGFSPQGGWGLPEMVRRSAIQEELGVEPLLLCVERSQLRWFGHLIRMPTGRLPREVFLAPPTGRRPRGRPRTRWRRVERGLYLLSGLGVPGDSPVRVSRCGWGKGSLGLAAEAAAPATRPWISD